MSEEFRELKLAFIKATKCVLKTKISRNVNLHKIYIDNICDAYNNAIKHALAKKVSSWPEPNYSAAKETLKYFRAKLTECCNKLNVKFVIAKNLLKLVDKEELIKSLDDFHAKNQFTYSDDYETDATDESIDSLPELSFIEAEPNMAPPEVTVMDNIEYTRYASTQIRENFSGDPLTLKSFINKVKLLKVNTPPQHVENLVLFVKTKLDDVALDYIPDEVNTIDGIIQRLQSKIKPDNSKVIGGRMMTIKMDRKNPSEFAKHAEELAVAFKRALVLEGVSDEKAEEMTIDQTIEMCGPMAQSERVKSVLDATPFASPKEVIAKLLTTNIKATNERQVLALQKYQRKNNFYQNGNSNSRGNKQNNFRGNYRNNRGNYQNNGNRGRGGFRGRGRGRARGRGYYQNNQYNVRYAENAEAPQAIDLGALIRNSQPRQ